MIYNDPAFPEVRIKAGDNYNQSTKVYYKGMSLRDWFAGQALMGMLADSLRTENLNDVLGDDDELAKLNASWAYDLANAMMERREK